MASTAASPARAPRADLGERGAGLLTGGASGSHLIGTDPDLARLAAVAGRRARSRERRCARPQVAIDDLVDDASSSSLRGRDRLAVGAHLDRQRHAGEPRQPLGAARAGDDAEEHFRLSDLRVLDGDAVVAGHGNLEPSTERLAVDGGDERLARVFETAEQGVRARGARHRLVARLQRLEDVDVGARDEGVARPDQDDRVYGGIVVRACDALIDSLPDAGSKGVDRRVVDRQNGDAVDDFVVHEFRHRNSSKR